MSRELSENEAEDVPRCFLAKLQIELLCSISFHSQDSLEVTNLIHNLATLCFPLRSQWGTYSPDFDLNHRLLILLFLSC